MGRWLKVGNEVLWCRRHGPSHRPKPRVVSPPVPKVKCMPKRAMPKKPLWLRETENKRAVELEPAVERERAGAKVRKAAENKRAVELERARNEYAEELRAINDDEWMRARTWIMDEEWPSAPDWGDTDDLVDAHDIS